MTIEEAIKCIKIHMHIHRMAEDRAVYITEALNMAIEALEAQKWTPVSERLPDKDGFYLVNTKSGIEIQEFLSGNSHYKDVPSFVSETLGRCNGYVLAWMPLPEPYKERREEHD